MKTIKQYHAEWAAKVMPNGASQTQQQEQERAFYAGALSCFALQMNEIAPLPGKKADAAMLALRNELEDYFRLLTTIKTRDGIERQ